MDNIDIRHDEYLKRRDEFLKIRESSQSSFDKSVLNLSTGGLVLTITFLDKIGKPFDLPSYWAIGLTWIFLFLTIFFNVLSYFFAKKTWIKN